MNAGVVTLDTTKITYALPGQNLGGSNIGLSATGLGSLISANGTAVTMVNVGGSDTGVSAASGAQVTLTGGSITIGGGGGGERGLRSTDSGSLVSATNTAVNVSGAGGNAGVNAANGGIIETSGGSVSVVNGTGGLVESGGIVNMNGTNVTASGSGGFGFQFSNGAVNLLRYGSGVIEASQASFSVQGATGDIILDGTTAVANNNTLLETNGGGNTLFIARGSKLRGVITTPAGNTSNVTLTQATVPAVATVWTMTGNSTATSVTNDNSQIIYSPPTGDLSQLASYKTLTVRDYVGRAGSIALNTFLGTDGSPSDRLVILGGQASGTSALLVSNTIGAGDLTLGNGILVVDAQNGGTTSSGAFSLGRPVVAGPYEYTLYRGSTDTSGPQNWYLRNTSTPGPIPPEPGPIPPEPGPIPPEPTPIPPNPTPIPPAPAPIPNYRREVSLYSALPSMGLIYGRTMIDSLHERVGEQGMLEAPPVTEERTIWCKNPETNFRCTTTLRLPVSSAAAGRSYTAAGWARIIGTHGNQNGGRGGIFGSGPNFDYDIYGLQAGLDLYRNYNADGSRDHAGIYGAIGRIQGDVRHFNGINAGTNTIDGYSIGAYWTHFGASGWYLDGVLQGTWFDAQADSRRLIKLNREGFGFAASLEGGYPIALGNGWIIEPQAQVIYQTLVNGSGNDGAALVRFSEVESLAGRIGARLARSWALEEGTTTSKPRMMTAWLKASLWNEFLGSPMTSFSSATGFIPFRSDLGGAWGEIKAGIDAQITRNTAIYASAGYSIGLDGRSHAYDGRVGIKFSW
ncbi:autotransporter family protein [Bosea sp. NBC_00550]|uniref:autotransporter family protein n=1 Tax=Bosea sp. NBC_00550 TaxID=2969621 RepID=UPI0022307F85|nr:autotransporter outer membrane beta-barrel domain-containing protein [Bosea sp. NBC_00550]UZF91271.1 autotransporter outer membrane beta-barrel domain-containing protein [Bosea sp. NBC_00550]